MDHKLAKTQTINLPDHLILEHILPRLPLKTLLRFKSVCKIWYTTISTYKFGKTQLKFSSPQPQFLLIERSLLRNRCCFLRSKNEAIVRGYGGFECCYKPKPRGSILGSCNGLLCFQYNINRFTVWNWATTQYRKVAFHNDDIGFTMSCGFGYASVSDDYKIVILCCGATNVFQVYVFSLRLGRWRKVDDGAEVDYETYIVSRNKSVLIDTTLYWCPQNTDERILSFGFDDEKLVMNPYMNWLKEYYSVDLVQIRGCLSSCCRSYVMAIGVFDVWMLKQPGDWNSWGIIYSLDFGGVPLFSLGEVDSRCLVHDVDSNRVKVVNLSRDGMETYQGEIDIDDDIAQVWIYVESLISPFELANDDEVNGI